MPLFLGYPNPDCGCGCGTTGHGGACCPGTSVAEDSTTMTDTGPEPQVYHPIWQAEPSGRSVTYAGGAMPMAWYATDAHLLPSGDPLVVMILCVPSYGFCVWAYAPTGPAINLGNPGGAGVQPFLVYGAGTGICHPLFYAASDGRNTHTWTP